MDGFWGILHPGFCYIQALEVYHAGGVVSVSARTQCPGSYDEVVAESKAVSLDMLMNQRQSGERFARSAINFAALLYGREWGCKAADPDAVAKLLSAAKWWGPGTSGWQQWDETYLCTDERNFFGVLVAEQGRLLWRTPDGSCSFSLDSITRRNYVAGATSYGLTRRGLLEHSTPGEVPRQAITESGKPPHLDTSTRENEESLAQESNLSSENSSLSCFAPIAKCTGQCLLCALEAGVLKGFSQRMSFVFHCVFGEAVVRDGGEIAV
jgi:hypothetical protein